MRKIILLAIVVLTASCASQKSEIQNTPPKPVWAECVVACGARPGWSFGCAWNGTCDASTSGSDRIGNYVQTTVHLQRQGIPLAEQIRKYRDRPVTLFSVTYEAPAPKPVVKFPDFDHIPAGCHVMSYRDDTFTPPTFHASPGGSPWVFFDDAGDTCIISPASHFFIQTLTGDAKSHVVSQLRDSVTNIPAGFTQQTLVACCKGINHTFEQWGQALTDLQGKSRPANDADPGLKYLGYWTDNGTVYYYNFDPSLGYAGTLLALEKHFRDAGIPVGYFQLDSWWYFKTFTGPDGKAGKTKNPKLPEGEWNRYGGLLKYRAHPAVIPQGLQAFQHDLGLPLITHNRWIDPASPYHQKYRISGYAAVDPDFWNDIISYIAGAGVITYEQDWLVDIFKHSPELASSTTAGDAFADGMANACASRGLSMQYCMATAPFFMQGSKYSNLTTIRCSDDRLIRPRWHNFLYTSRLASALGIWPWTDPYLSSETGNILLSNLSAGMVGFGDAMGTEDQANIFRAVRSDGVIVKPDAPIVPTDSAYLAEAAGQHPALIASTYTDHGDRRTQYVLAFRIPGPEPKHHKNEPGRALSDREEIPPAQDGAATNAKFTLADLGITGPAYLYDFLAQKPLRLGPTESLDAPLSDDGFNYYIVAEPGISGIAFFGDAGKFVSSGKQRIASITETATTLTAAVVFAPGEQSIRLHGCCASTVHATAAGQPLNVSYDPTTGHFATTIDASLPGDAPNPADGTHILRVTFQRD